MPTTEAQTTSRDIKEGLGGTETRAGDYVTNTKEPGKPMEIFLASDASAVVEHTKKVMIIEDDEVVHIKVQTLVPAYRLVLNFRT